MLSLKDIRNNPHKYKIGFIKRRIFENENISLNEALKNIENIKVKELDEIIELDRKRRDLIYEIEEIKREKNKVSKEIGMLKRENKDINLILDNMKTLAQKEKELNNNLKITKEKLNNLLITLPNIPSEDVPIGSDETHNKLIKEYKKTKKFNFKPLSHYELGEKLGMMDFKRAAKISGSRFVVLYDKLALLEWALMRFMLNVQMKQGYKLVLPPFLVNTNSMIGTGQLPKFKEDAFKCENHDLYLIPTAEVPVTNLHRDEILDKNLLPIKYCAYTPCFRSEAGAYGKDVKGIIRQHQFNKVELVKFTSPEESEDEHLSLLKDAEKILELLDLPYRVMLLCSQDMGFSAQKCYDLEVWIPSENKYREISSCSNFGDFQARRANIRYRPEKGKKLEFVHTINGSGLAIGRTLIAIMENYQNEDGSITIPEVLRPYMNNIEVIKV